jgi:hypothetical protein
LDDSSKKEGISKYINENAIDSNRAVAFAYYARRLLFNGWKAFFNNRLDNSNEKLHERIGSQRFLKNTKKKVFKALFKNAKLHRGHGSSRIRSLVFFNQKIGSKYMKMWIEKYHRK